MSYAEEIKRRLQIQDLWPESENPHFVDELDNLAKESLAKNTVEGALAAVLIYHQLTEEMLRVLLQCSQFFIQLAIFPAELDFPKPKRQVFGDLLQKVKHTPSFLHKAEILDLAEQLNSNRIDIVHKLVQRQTLSDVVSQATEVERIYNRLFAQFNAAWDEFRVTFSRFRKDAEDMFDE